MSEKQGQNAILDIITQVFLLIMGIFFVLPTLTPAGLGIDFFAVLFSVGMLEFVTIMIGVLFTAQIALYTFWIILGLGKKLNPWLYPIFGSLIAAIWVSYIMTSYFVPLVNILAGDLVTFLTLASLVFITGIVAPMLRMIVSGK